MLGRIAAVAAIAAGGVLLSKRMKGRSRSGSGTGSFVETGIDVEVPVSTAYNQWTQFEEFPQFMHSVHEVRQLDDTHLHWRATVAGQDKEPSRSRTSGSPGAARPAQPTPASSPSKSCPRAPPRSPFE